MLSPMEVFRGVFVFRRIAAADMSAFQAHPEMYPLVACLDAFLTNVLVSMSELDLIHVRAWLARRWACHNYSFSY